ncbi:hypothetical protein E0Z10_g3035 [Xylaria hypoxylon]|uniref:Fe2OG dioxygenase domain-containing protein n=1 Tax=Xylaria hypoxylon TaxID=37992 RepID=A0A4Z0Z2G9_9PEZI|nr:hypothetical protein E0Z10_g3035 [Xylaria hypoxylon]
MSLSVPLPEGLKPALIRVIDLKKLQSGSASEQASLLQAGTEDGFFYLKLDCLAPVPVWNNAAKVFKLSEALFAYDDAVKYAFDVDGISNRKVNGYKPKGRNIVDKSGTRDGFESWVLPGNGLFQLGEDPFPHPPAVAASMGSLRALIDDLRSAAETIFKSLSTSLELKAGQRFEDFHNPTRPMPDILRLLKYHADQRIGGAVPQTPHTDLGSLTFVFTTTPGLQVLPASIQTKTGVPYPELRWQYVEPREGCAIVNLGDCMTKMTNGLLKSALHRVGPLPGSPMSERYSLAYLMRPEGSTLLRTLDSPLIQRPEAEEAPMTSNEWIHNKFLALRGAHRVQDDHVLTGGKDVIV